jgi:glycosyltransferase involved in cell wall biosynthesis
MSDFPNSIRLPAPVRITEQVWPEGTVPVVSVLCITYNHVNFIRDAIEGFLMQETNFPVQIFIHDDASTDGTSNIVKEYSEKYPKLFWTILQTENQWSKGNINAFFFGFMQKLGGEFIALCEGDDYWTDNRKLQVQVDFLYRNAGFSACGHGAHYMNEKNEILGFMPPEEYRRDYSKDELINVHAWIATNSLVFRNVIQGCPKDLSNVLHGDNVITSLLGHHGKFKYLKEIKPFIYREHLGGVWSALGVRDKKMEQVNTMVGLFRYYKKLGLEKHAQSYYETIKFQMMNEYSTKELLRESIKRMKPKMPNVLSWLRRTPLRAPLRKLRQILFRRGL